MFAVESAHNTSVGTSQLTLLVLSATPLLEAVVVVAVDVSKNSFMISDMVVPSRITWIPNWLGSM